MRQLLFSSSRVGTSGYLEMAKSEIMEFCGNRVKNALFVPFAGVSIGYQQYFEMVKEALAGADIEISLLTPSQNQAQLIENADLIIVGGGNTFALLKRLQQVASSQADKVGSRSVNDRLIDKIRTKCLDGTPYIGWSAGSNIAAPSICTTNDMPIIEPESFSALGLLPFQINPHYIDGNPAGHNGETRQQRIEEYLALNSQQCVVALPEGCWLRRENNKLTYRGQFTGFIFRHNQNEELLKDGSDLSYLLDQ